VAYDGELPEVGAPRSRPEIDKQQQKENREQESELSSCVADALPPAIVKKLSRQSSQFSARRDTSNGEKKPFGSDGSAAASSDVVRSSSRVSHPPYSVRMNTGYSQDSQRDFADCSQTIIIFDWDDTLCPSTCMRSIADFDRDGKLKTRFRRETRDELKLLEGVVVPLLQLAQSMGKVILVTNAKAPWVDISCQSFLPQVKEILKDIPVTYALELVKENGLDGFNQREGCLLTETKARAMRAAVSQFYSQYPNQSWKNIVSIGDAYFEHDAIRQVVGGRSQEKPCRTKTIKLLEGPTIPGMIVQLSIIKVWLQNIVRADSDVDIDLSADEETVNHWVNMYGEVHE